MPRIIDERDAVPALAAMVGCASVDGGPTDEQLALVDALATGYFHVPFDHDAVEPLAPAAAGAAFPDAEKRRRLCHLLVFVEMCRHPLTEAQVARTDAYIAALGHDQPDGPAMARDFVEQGAAVSRADFFRSFARVEPDLREPTLAGSPGSAPLTRDAGLAARIAGLRDCPEGSLGRAYIAFYDRYGFALPGTDDQPAAVFVAHDMAHVIAGYEPDGVGEIALGAMQLAFSDSDAHWVQFLGNLGVHEAGYIAADGPPGAALSRPGALATVAEAFERGVACLADFSLADHLAIADQPLEAVRASFGIPPRRA